jgi:glycosyltransferase involved in cell wall biosynthesis
MKIICLNNYPLDKAVKSHESGLLPANHLWGIDFFSKRGINCNILPFEKFSLLRKISPLYFLGDLDKQVRVLIELMKGQYDFVYTAHQNMVWTLAYLRKICPKIPPIIAVLHSIPDLKIRILNKLLAIHLSTLDVIICISKKNYNFLINEAGFSKEKVFFIEWGVDLEFYKPKKVEKKIIFSAGKSSRDYHTLCEAVKDLDVECVISCDAKNIDNLNIKQYHNVQFITDLIPYKDLIDLYNQSLVTVVPLANIKRCFGITSVLEALAMESPVILTKTQHIEVHLVDENCGVYVKKGDVEDLKNKIKYFLENKSMAREMGVRGRKYVTRKYNNDSFAEQVVGVFNSRE